MQSRTPATARLHENRHANSKTQSLGAAARSRLEGRPASASLSFKRNCKSTKRAPPKSQRPTHAKSPSSKKRIAKRPNGRSRPRRRLSADWPRSARNSPKPCDFSIAPKPRSSSERTGRSDLESQLEQLDAQLQMIRESRWLKLGRTFGLGPNQARPVRTVDAAIAPGVSAWRILEGLPLALLSPSSPAARRARFCFCATSSAPLRPRRTPTASTQARHALRQHRHPQLERPRPAREVSAVGARCRRPMSRQRSHRRRQRLDGRQRAVHSRNISPGARAGARPKNLGFGGGSNAGFRAARNDIVVLLNSDMRVERDFLRPLLDGFTDDKDLRRLLPDLLFRSRQNCAKKPDSPKAGGSKALCASAIASTETIRELYPCFYGGGGSCAFDRRKFLELGGFDALLAPFYLEDTDLGYLAWKRGWKVLYQPASVVYHEHRGTIGKQFQRSLHSVRPQKELPALHLEEHPRLAAAWLALLLHLGRRDVELARRRFAGALQLLRDRARRVATPASACISRASPRARA